MIKGTESHAYFPLFVDLREKRVLVVGAGAIGMRRAAVLSQFGADVRIVAPECAAHNEEAYGESNLVWEKRTFVPEDIDGCFLVIAATDDDVLNGQIACLCREQGIYVNHAGDQSQCDFYFPAIAMEENLVVGITSSGEDHRLVRWLAARLRVWLKQTLAQKYKEMDQSMF